MPIWRCLINDRLLPRQHLLHRQVLRCVINHNEADIIPFGGARGGGDFKNASFPHYVQWMKRHHMLPRLYAGMHPRRLIALCSTSVMTELCQHPGYGLTLNIAKCGSAEKKRWSFTRYFLNFHCFFFCFFLSALAVKPGTAVSISITECPVQA